MLYGLLPVFLPPSHATALTPPAAPSSTKLFFYLQANRLTQVLKKKSKEKECSVQKLQYLKKLASDNIFPAFNFVRPGVLVKGEI